MKKIMSWILLFTLVLSLCACAKSETQEKTENKKQSAVLAPLGDYDLYAGFGRENITPEEPTPLGGYSNPANRTHTAVLDDLYVTCIALTDAKGETILLMNWDGVRSHTSAQDAARMSIETATGIPIDHIFIGATHSHSAPDMTYRHEIIERYTGMVLNKAVACAEEALADRRPANMSAGSVEAEGLNFVRHYVTTLDDGTVSYFGDNFGTSAFNDTTTHTTKADPTMFMLYFDMAEGNDMTLINWRAHPHFTGGSSRYDLSSDWIGPFRDAFEYQTGVDMLYFNGAAGNINEKSRILEENKTTDYKTHGKLLADYAIDIMKNHLEPTPVDEIKTKQTMYEAVTNHSQDDLYGLATNVNAIYKATGDKEQALAAGEGKIRSTFHATAVINNYKRGNTETRELNAIYLGESVGMFSAPNELFDTNAVEVEEASPFKYTLTLGYTNGHHGYIPSAFAWEYTSYETDITALQPGTGELYAKCFVDMLEQLHAE